MQVPPPSEKGPGARGKQTQTTRNTKNEATTDEIPSKKPKKSTPAEKPDADEGRTETVQKVVKPKKEPKAKPLPDAVHKLFMSAPPADDSVEMWNACAVGNDESD